jgi:hypothetical protein
MATGVGSGASSLAGRVAALWRDSKVLDSAGVTAATVIFLCVNVLSARFFVRTDTTRAQVFTLSDATRTTLGRLDAPVSVTVLMSRTDPLTQSVTRLLEEYKAVTNWVQPEYIDPDRNPAQFVEVQHRYGLLEGRTEDGRIASDASIVLSQQGKHWFVTTDDIVAYDEHADLATPKLEQVLTEGIARVLGQRRRVACFTRGFQELSAEAGGPQGLGEFRRQLERNNYEVRSVDLSLAKLSEPLLGCNVTFVVGPTEPYSQAATNELKRSVSNGEGLFFAIGPITSDDGRIVDANFDAVFSPLGIKAGNNAVFEGDETLRLPIGIGGEVFLATPRAHAVTAGLLHGDEVRHRVLLQLGQSFTRSAESETSVLLESSNLATALETFREIRDDDVGNPASAQSFVMAVAGEFPGGGQKRRGRVVVVGSPSVLWSSTWREPALVGTRRFVESAVAWLAAEAPLVSVPEKPPQPAGLALTDAGVKEVRTYVLFYLPGGVALIGVLLLWGRRREGALSRRGEDT